jgi:hypothetical protein
MMLGFGIRYGMSLQSVAVLLFPFGLAAVAGAGLLIDNEREALSIVAQLPQVLFWSTGGGAAAIAADSYRENFTKDPTWGGVSGWDLLPVVGTLRAGWDAYHTCFK